MNCKKIVVFVLFVMLITIFCFTAFADTSSVKMGQTKYKTYNNLKKAPTYQLKIVGQPYQKFTVILSFWDKNEEKELIKKYKTWEKVPKSKKNSPWKRSNTKSVTFSLTQQKSYIISISQTSAFKFVNEERTPKARLTFIAEKTDKTKIGFNDPIQVTYPD